MSATIESAGLFAEAAYGVDGPQGVGGVTGGGESHEIAWKQALQDAKSSLPQTSPTQDALPQAGAVIVEESTTAANTATSNIKAANPVSWDRLSMTVASMVAWNMSVELADDVSASPIVAQPLSDTANWTSDATATMNDSELLTTQASQPQSNLATTGDLDANTAIGVVSSPNQQFTSDEVMAVSPDNTDFTQSFGLLDDGDDSGSTTEALGDRYTDSSSRNGAEQQASDLWAQDVDVPTAPLQEASQVIAIQPAVAAAVTPMGAEGATTLQASAQPIRNTGVDESVNETSQPANASNRDGTAFESVIRVRSTSVEPPEITQGRQRLEAIRNVLAQLDQQAVERNTVSEVIRRPALNPQSSMSSMPAMAGAVGASTVPGPGTRGVDPMVPPTSSSVDQSSGEPFVEPDPTSGRPINGTANRLDRQPARMMTTGRTSPNATVAGRESSAVDVNPLTGMSAEAGVIGAENSEITQDQLSAIETFKVDAEVIDASEIPELAVQDVSHLDIDIDDPMGTVRLAMTREAEEVSIRMETPEEVLQQYREMEEEMADAIANQGLDLGQFSADAQNSDGDQASSDTLDPKQSFTDPKQASGESEESLEQSGTVSRLVNRIV